MKHERIRDRVANLDGRQTAALDDVIVRAADELATHLEPVFVPGPGHEGLTSLEVLELKAEIIDALRRRFGELDAGVAPPTIPLTHEQRRARRAQVLAEAAAILRDNAEGPAFKIIDAPTVLPEGVRAFDLMIGRLDRVLSEVMIAAEECDDNADHQTLKHHADDLIGVGKAVLKRLGETSDE